jgi:hypothetical protein
MWLLSRISQLGFSSALVTTVVGMMAVGCHPPALKHVEDSPLTADSPFRPVASPEVGPQGNVFHRPAQRLSIEFKVHRIWAPRGSLTSDAAVWSRVPGSLPSAAQIARLADNGLRAAVGRESDREPLLTALREIPRLRMALDQVSPDPAKPLEMVIGPRPGRESVFHIDRRGDLHGIDFVDGQVEFEVSFALRTADLATVSLKSTPLVREPPGPLKWVLTEEGAQQVPEERLRRFADLAVSCEVPPGGFLLLGPTETVYDRPLLGRMFFLEEGPATDGAEAQRESLCVISPLVRVLASRGATPAAP